MPAANISVVARASGGGESPPRHRSTLRATCSTVERHDSMGLVVARLCRSNSEKLYF
jgi:hypothetical protein